MLWSGLKSDNFLMSDSGDVDDETTDEYEDVWRRVYGDNIPEKPDRFEPYPHDEEPISFGDWWDQLAGHLMVSGSPGEWILYYGELVDREDFGLPDDDDEE